MTSLESGLVPALQLLTQSFHDSVDASRKELQAATSVYQFMSIQEEELTQTTKIKMRRLFQCAVFGQAEFMKKLGVGSREEMEQLWGQQLGDPDVRKAVDAFKDAEKKWLDFVQEVDQMLALEEDKLTITGAATIGKQLRRDLHVIDGSSGSTLDIGTVCNQSPHTLFMYIRHFS